MQILYKHLILLIALGVLVLHYQQAGAQIQQGGTPASIEYGLSVEKIPVKILSLTPQQEEIKTLRSGTYTPGEPMHAGFALNAGYNPVNHGEWTIINDSLRIWRIRLKSPGASGVGVNFDAFQLGQGSRLFFYDPHKKIIIGSFDHRNNNAHQIFATHIIPGEELIVEYQELYTEGKPLLENTLLNIESLIYISDGGNMGVFSNTRNLGNADECHVNINCPEGNNWQQQKRAVARMLMRTGNSYSWCTGSLVNNTAQDQTPYFLSSEHCGRQADEQDMLYWQFYFNFERPVCEDMGTPAYDMIVGCQNISLGPLQGGSDFRLLELSTTPPPHYNPYYLGWDRSENISNSGVGIHHPAGDAKKISTYEMPLVSSNPLVSGQQMATNSAWQVRWSETETDHGVTQGGSSGSPIFNTQGLVIGTLTGGSSTCNNPFSPDYYGKFSYHWDENGPDIDQQMAPFLDPLSTGQLALEGLDPFREDFPPPGHLLAQRNQNQISLQWFPPGSFPNPPGWYSYVSSYSHLTPAGPERATLFDAVHFELSYPLTLSGLSHMFVQQNGTWPDNSFRFVVYGSDGLTELYLSPVLNAVHLQPVQHQLTQPLVVDEKFYVAIRPSHSSGQPSSLMMEVNYAQGYSFVGSPGNWDPYNSSPNVGQWTSYSFYTSIQVGDQPGKTLSLHSMPDHPHYIEIDHSGFEDSSREVFNRQVPDNYRLYRDFQLIHTTSGASDFSYQETMNFTGLFLYHATAVYNGNESAFSNPAYLLVPPACDQIISQWPWQEDFDADFDDSCWLSFTNEQAQWQLTTEFNWEQNTVLPFQGDQYYVINIQSEQDIDAWLITPRVNLSQLNNPALQFAFNGEFTQAPQSFLAVLVSADGGSFEKVWDSNLHAEFSPENPQAEWHQATVNLENYGSVESLRIAFQIIGQGEAFAAIDNIRIVPAQGIRYTVNVNVQPSSDAGVVTGMGQYLAGETVTLVANPNVAQVFSDWRTGGNVLSTQQVYQFIMPANNLNITANFSDDPTDIVELAVNPDLANAFPNPTQNNILLQFNKNYIELDISLLNPLGQVIEQTKLKDIYPGMQQEIKMTHLPVGIYYIGLQSGSQYQLIRIVRTH